MTVAELNTISAGGGYAGGSCDAIAVKPVGVGSRVGREARFGDLYRYLDLQAGLGMVDATFRTSAEFIGRPYDSLLAPGMPHEPEELKADAMLRDKAAAFGRKLAKG